MHVCMRVVLLALSLSTTRAQYVPAVPRSLVYPMVNSTDPDPSAWTGFEIDILEWMCNGSQTLGSGVDNSPILDCAPRDEWIVGELPDVFQAVENGTADFAMGILSRSDEREKTYTFIKPYYYSSGAVLYVLPGENSGLTFERLEGKPVCALQGYYLADNNDDLKGVYGVSDVVSVPTMKDAIKKLESGECIAMVGDEVARLYGQSLGLSVVGNTVAEEPIGIITRKNAPSTLKADISYGIVSTAWDGNDSLILDAENTFLIQNGFPANKNLLGLVSAVTAMSTKKGFNVTWSETTPVFSGEESVNSSGTKYNVSIVMFDGALPLASLEGNRTFLQAGSNWTGLEVEMGKVICNSEYFNCIDVFKTDTLSDRLSYLDQGIANISIGSIVVTQERLDTYPFIQPMYFATGPAIYVNQSISVDTTQPGLEYAEGKTLCSLVGSAYNEQAETAGATLINFDSNSEAIKAVSSGDCDGFLYDSNVSLEKEGLKQAAADMSSALPMGIAVAGTIPYSVCTSLSSIMVDLLDNFPESKLILWSKEYEAGATPNPLLYQTSESISDFVLARNNQSESNAAGPSPPESSAAVYSLKHVLLCFVVISSATRVMALTNMHQLP